jgi:hypothetical protein
MNKLLAPASLLQQSAIAESKIAKAEARGTAAR